MNIILYLFHVINSYSIATRSQVLKLFSERGTFMKKRVLSALLVSALALTTMPGQTFAEESTDSVKKLSYEGYKEVWSDDFDGDTLNRDDWNVELHEKGWVNSELQEYVDSEENIQVKDGKLVINPVEKVETITTEGAQNLLTNADFSDGFTGWEETIANWDKSAEATRSQGDGQIVYDITKAGTEDWHVQLKHNQVTVEAGKTYKVSFKATSTATRTICSGVMNGTTYEQYGQKYVQLNVDEETVVSYTFTPAVTDDNSIYYFSLGKMENEAAIASKITLSDISLSVEPSNMVSADAFGANADNGVITKEVNSSNMGSNPWDVQILQDGINVEAGESYEVSFKASATTSRKIVAGVQKTSADYDQYGQGTFELTTEPKEYTYEVKSSTTDSNAGIYFNLGKSADGETPDSIIKISDVKMIKKVVPGTKVKKSYTSGRISTQNKQTFTYGLFEARVKVPKGQGFLPAFWLMANDENVYGQWPRCGEIDCMEVMGQDTSKAYGTIHFGNPHSESQGTYITGEDEKDFSEDFHTFSCEWEPGVIRWYVDGILFHEESDWYSTTEGQGTLTYPAPFDQPFYIILNLAVGGSWVGNPDDNTSFDNNPYEVDYVRVYQKDGYDEDVHRPVKDVVIREPQADGNYINNGNFATAEDLADEKDWKFLTALGGEATAEIKDNKMSIKTTAEGTVDYSVQLVQADIPFVKGATYEVSFDANASEARTMGVDIKAPDHGYKSYMPHQDAELTTETQNYKYTFVMKDDTDANGRLEYNMGAMGSTADINISNVVVKKIADPDPNAKEEKTVLANGNYIYNGSFQEGDKHLGYWDIAKTYNATAYVSGYTDGRRFCLRSNDGQIAKATLSQDDLTFAEGKPYTLSFTAKAKEDTVLTVNLGGKKYNVSVKGGTDETYTISLPSSAKYDNKKIAIKFETIQEIAIDNIKLVESALIKNGSFNDGLSGFEVYVDSSAKASYVVDSLKEDNSLSLTVDKSGDADWKIQVKQNNVPLEQGKKYKLTFKAKSSLDRDIRVIMQGNEAHGWPVYSTDKTIRITDEFQTFTDTFTMKADTDKEAFLSICLGNVAEEINDQHTVVIDDITLEDLSDSEGEGDDTSDDNGIISEDVSEPVDVEVSSSNKVDEYNFIDAVNEGVDVVIHVTDSNGKTLYKWTFENKDIDLSKLNGNGPLDLTVEFATAKEEKIQSLVNGVGKAMFIEIPNFSGDLPGKATLTIPVGKKYKDGQKVYLYYYDEKDGKVEKVGDALTVVDGMVDVQLAHCSVYFLSDKSDIEMKNSTTTLPNPSTLTNTKPATQNVVEAAKTSETVAKPAAKTGDNSPIMIYALGIIVGALGLVFARKRKFN